MRACWIAGVVLVTGLVPAGAGARGQVVERRTEVTGPRGRTINRQSVRERGPGFAEREIMIRRPGGTIERDVRVQGPVRGPSYGPRYGPPRGVYFNRPNVIVERNYFVPRPAPFLGLNLGFATPFFGFGFGAPAPLPVIVPQPVMVPQPVPVPQPVLVPQPAYGAAMPPPGVAVDAFADAYGRLGSNHNHSRRDGALALGRLRDPRAVPGLVDRLQKDWYEEVRVASAWALGEIGDPRAALPLQKAALYDKRSEVREIAQAAYRRLPPASDPVTAQANPNVSAPVANPTVPPTVEPPAGAVEPPPTGLTPTPTLTPPPTSPETPPPPPEPFPGVGENP
jgi:hypothetical protein